MFRLESQTKSWAWGLCLCACVVGGLATGVRAADVSRAEEVVEGESVRIVRDVAFQRLLGDVAATKSGDAFETKLIPLRRAAEKDWPGFFAQLLLRYSDHREEAGEAATKLFVGRVLAGLKPERSAAVEALAPQLDNEVPVIAAFARVMVMGVPLTAVCVAETQRSTVSTMGSSGSVCTNPRHESSSTCQCFVNPLTKRL